MSESESHSDPNPSEEFLKSHSDPNPSGEFSELNTLSPLDFFPAYIKIYLSSTGTYYCVMERIKSFCEQNEEKSEDPSDKGVSFFQFYSDLECLNTFEKLYKQMRSSLNGKVNYKICYWENQLFNAYERYIYFIYDNVKSCEWKKNIARIIYNNSYSYTIRGSGDQCKLNVLENI